MKDNTHDASTPCAPVCIWYVNSNTGCLTSVDLSGVPVVMPSAVRVVVTLWVLILSKVFHILSAWDYILFHLTSLSTSSRGTVWRVTARGTSWKITHFDMRSIVRGACVKESSEAVGKETHVLVELNKLPQRWSFNGRELSRFRCCYDRTTVRIALYELITVS